MTDHEGVCPELELFSDDVLVTPLGPIVVSPGATLNIEGGKTYSLEALTIQAGGIARINFLPGTSNKWTCIKVSGDVVIAGHLICTNVPCAADLSATTSVNYVAPDGTQLSHAYGYKKGGAGGHGGGWPGLTNAPGGAGAVGDWQAGGGGGGGTTQNGERRPANRSRAGMPANGIVGGAALYDYKHWGGKGGDAAPPNYSADGGLLYLRVDGNLIGSGGTIDVRGAPGIGGISGQSGGGGGGGGAGGGPGYPGGALYLLCSNILSVPQVLLAEAPGGAAGLGARSLNTFPGNGGQENGTSGMSGENGNAAVFKLILPPW